MGGWGLGRRLGGRGPRRRWSVGVGGWVRRRRKSGWGGWVGEEKVKRNK